MTGRLLVALLWLTGAFIGVATLLSKPAAAADLQYFYCYAPSPAIGTTYMSDVHPVGPVAERRTYGDQFVSFLKSKGKISGSATGYCVMRATMKEIDEGRSNMAQAPCSECKGAEKIAEIQWPRGDGKPDLGEAFQIQADAEWKRVSKDLPKEHKVAGQTAAYCYQDSLVDSVLYESGIFATDKQPTELEIAFAAEVAKKTRIQSAMSTYCHLSADKEYLQSVQYNVKQVHPDRKVEELRSPR
jgi:hypothetical protein